MRATAWQPQPAGVVLGAGAQFITSVPLPEVAQTPGVNTPVSSFSLSVLGQKADKIGKDDNFRGMTVFNNVLYFTKGSGSNGINTVYFVDTTGKACPNGVGLPASGAALPSSPLPYDASTLATTGLPTNMCVLAGFPSTPNKSATTAAYPFGIWFADANTLYVADEGDGYTGGSDPVYTRGGAGHGRSAEVGVQCHDEELGAGLHPAGRACPGSALLGARLPGRRQSGHQPAPWSPATDGLRNFTGRVDRDGKVTLWAVTSTVSGNGDIGADPNRLVSDP